MAGRARSKSSILDLLTEEGLWAGTRSYVGMSGARLVFRPGSGRRPPLLVGRNGAIEALRDLVSSLATDTVEPSFGALIYGPRGTGKTVLLGVVLECAREAGVACVPLEGQSLQSPEDLRRALLAGRAWRSEASRESGGRLGLGPLGGLLRRWKMLSRIGEPDAKQALGIIADRRRCLLVVDEAHVMDAGTGGQLLSAVQALCVDGQRIAVVLAGTPDLPQHIRTMQASFFFSRLHPRMQIGCGLVTDEEALAGVTLPLASIIGLDTGPEWHERIPDLTRGYPYFIQLLGASIAEAYEGRCGRTTDEARNRAALDSFEQAVGIHYASVWEDLNDDNLTACAVQIGYLSDACAARGQVVSEAALNKAIESGVRHPLRPQGGSLGFDDARLRMTHFGLLWRPTLDAPLTVGIPSFFSYAADRAEQDGGDVLPALREERPALLAAAGLSTGAQ